MAAVSSEAFGVICQFQVENTFIFSFAIVAKQGSFQAFQKTRSIGH